MHTGEAVTGSERKRPVKDIIISVISREWPITAKRIYNRVKGQGLSVTYQAVHKAIKELTAEGTLIKEDKEYSIKPDWIKQNKRFYEELERMMMVGKNISIEEILSNDITEISFGNVYEFFSFTLDILEKIVEKSEQKLCVNEVHNMYWALSGSKKEQEQFRKILSLHPKTYFLCRGDTFADRMLAKFYEQFGAKVKTGFECARNNDIMAGGGYVLQIFFEKKTRDQIHKLYSNINESMQDLNRIYDQLFSIKTRINVIVKKDPELASEIIENVVKQFEK